MSINIGDRYRLNKLHIEFLRGRADENTVFEVTQISPYISMKSIDGLYGIHLDEEAVKSMMIKQDKVIYFEEDTDSMCFTVDGNRVTVVIDRFPHIFGEATCHKDDEFSIAIGLRLAISRAIAQIMEIESQNTKKTNAQIALMLDELIGCYDEIYDAEDMFKEYLNDNCEHDLEVFRDGVINRSGVYVYYADVRCKKCGRKKIMFEKSSADELPKSNDYVVLNSI